MTHKAMRTRILRLAFLVLPFAAGCGGAPDGPIRRELSPSVLMEIPQTRQATGYTCGVAVLQSLLAHNGILYRQDVLEKMVGATPERGTSPDSMIRCLHGHGIGAELVQNIDLPRLRAFIDAGRPVVCFLQAWNGDPAFDYADGWEDGHYAVAIGYDAERVYFMDPSTLSNYAHIGNHEFLQRWHDGDGEERFYRAGIVIDNPMPVYSRDAFKPML